jgi:hypothetical protein
VTYSPYSREQARANGLVRSTFLSRSRKGCCGVQRKIIVEGYLLFMESARAKALDEGTDEEHLLANPNGGIDTDSGSVTDLN